MNDAFDPFENFAELEQWLAACDSPYHPSAAHAVLTALACCPAVVVDDWIGATDDGTRALLRAAAQRLRASLFAEDLPFDLLLPPDETPMAERAEALGEWCRGFIAGLQMGRWNGRGADASVLEFVRDLGDLCHVVDDDDAESEDAYAELTEYVRVGVLLLAGVPLHDAPPAFGLPDELA